MHRNDPLNIDQFCYDPQKYPQSLHTPKNIHFSQNPKNIEMQNFELPNGVSPSY